MHSYVFSPPYIIPNSFYLKTTFHRNLFHLVYQTNIIPNIIYLKTNFHRNLFHLVYQMNLTWHEINKLIIATTYYHEFMTKKNHRMTSIIYMHRESWLTTITSVFQQCNGNKLMCWQTTSCWITWHISKTNKWIYPTHASTKLKSSKLLSYSMLSNISFNKIISKT